MSPPRRPRPFRAGKEARRRARQAIGLPPGERIIPDKRKKPARHKKAWKREDAE